jgi:hypothetical protein
VLHLGVTVVFKIGDEVNLVNKKFFSAWAWCHKGI